MPGSPAVDESLCATMESSTYLGETHPLNPAVEAHMISPRSVFSTDDLEKRATEAKDKRCKDANSREARKGAILDSLGKYQISDNYLSPADDLLARNDWSVQPKTITRPRPPFRWNNMQLEHVDGEVVPSDQAYADTILDTECDLLAGTTWANYIEIQSFTDKSEVIVDDTVQYTNTHNVLYQGEKVWTLVTNHFCCKEGLWGQSSSCIYMRAKGVLRVKIVHKGRKASGDGWNSIETREYRVEDIIKKSGEARGRALCQ